MGIADDEIWKSVPDRSPPRHHGWGGDIMQAVVSDLEIMGHKKSFEGFF